MRRRTTLGEGRHTPRGEDEPGRCGLPGEIWGPAGHASPVALHSASAPFDTSVAGVRLPVPGTPLIAVRSDALRNSSTCTRRFCSLLTLLALGSSQDACLRTCASGAMLERSCVKT